jgi:protein-tyrosine kinase
MSIVERALAKLQQRNPEESRAAAKSARPPAAQPLPAASGAPHPESHPTRTVQRPRISIDRGRLQEFGVLPPVSEQRRLAGEFRRIKRPLVERALAGASDAGSSASVVVISSAVPGEGKTFTAMNLALSLAMEQDASVLLIDADVLKPRISTILGIERRPGLLDAVSDASIDPEALICDTDVAGLSVLGAGTRAENATELLASIRMMELIARLRVADTRRIMLLDSPPLLITTESRELATVAGQIVLAVRAGFTPRQAVYDALALLGDSKPIGIVLNQVDSDADEAPYYGFGGYGSYGEPQRKDP